MRHIAVVTGTRAEYGLMKSTIKAIENSSSLEYSLVATGMHLSPLHGYTVDDIRNDGIPVTKEVETLIAGDSGYSMAKSLGVGLLGMADALEDIDPDIVLVLGDRDEAFAAGVAAAHMNIPLAHIHGGDAMEGAVIDDSIRHSLTKFAHIHFPASDESCERIRKMGEEPWRIKTVGAPGLDQILSGDYEPPDKVREALDLSSSDPIVVVVQHPVTTQVDHAGVQMAATLDGLSNIDAQYVLVYPNSDAGGTAMIDTIESHPATDTWTVVKNLPRQRYLGLLSIADVLIGNSSSGIIEAPSFNLPVVDIGPRQESRQRAENVVSVPHDSEAIRTAVQQCLTDNDTRERANCENPYEKGGAANRIVDVLESVPIDDRLLQKEITF